MTPAELFAWRSQNNVTQAELAKLLGVHWLTPSKWECGTRQIPPYLPLALEAIDIRNQRDGALVAACDAMVGLASACPSGDGMWDIPNTALKAIVKLLPQ